MTKMTVNGVTTTNTPGQEQYETFSRKVGGKTKKYYQYDYRHTDGVLFSCVKPTLEACREARDAWLEKRGGVTMLTATATWSNGVTKTETFNLEAERIIWLAELREWCEKKGYKLPTITKGAIV